jgi:hypothetical protein
MIPSDIQIKPLLHYCADSATAEWLREQIAMETEGETSPAQEPHPVVMDASTPALLRRQAA